MESLRNLLKSHPSLQGGLPEETPSSKLAVMTRQVTWLRELPVLPWSQVLPYLFRLQAREREPLPLLVLPASSPLPCCIQQLQD